MLHIAGDDGSIEDVERGGVVVPLRFLVIVPASRRLSGNPPKAFVDRERTTALAGGST
jgi:hypothetical protein